MNELKHIIIEKYGSVDNFIKLSNLTLSRVHVFKLLSGERPNPTLDSLTALSEALGLSIQEVADALHTRHRD